MGIFHIIAVALGLSADSFAVATTEGILLKTSKRSHSLRVAVVFGICQGAMPLLGWHTGTLIYGYIQPFGNLAACLLLSFIGAKMIFDAVFGNDKSPSRHSLGLKLWVLGVAVSLDAFAVGVSMAMMEILVWVPALLIGLVTAITSIIGVRLGDRIGHKIGGKAELAGGMVLILIGMSFLLNIR